MTAPLPAPPGDPVRASDSARYTWMGFVAMTFFILGILAVFVTYAAPLPLERALARDAVLDQALALSAHADAEQRIQALAPQLDDSAPAILHGTQPLPERIQAERSAMRARFLAEADGLATRLRLMIVVLTLISAALTAAIIGGIGRAGRS